MLGSSILGRARVIQNSGASGLGDNLSNHRNIRLEIETYSTDTTNQSSRPVNLVLMTSVMVTAYTHTQTHTPPWVVIVEEGDCGGDGSGSVLFLNYVSVSARLGDSDSDSSQRQRQRRG